MNIFTKFYAYLHLRWAVRLADKSYKKYNQRFYVLPGEDGNLVVSDRKNFRGLRSKHWIRGAYETDMKGVTRKSYYYTPYANGNDPMPYTEYKVKMIAYYGWYEKSKAEHRQRKAAAKAAAKARKANAKKAKKDARRK